MLFEDESGRGPVWAFVLAQPKGPGQLSEPVKKWRRRFYGSTQKVPRRRGLAVPQEYHDSKAPASQRRYLLALLSESDFELHAVVKLGYDPSWEYPYVVADLLKLARATGAQVIGLDRKDCQKRRARDREAIRGLTGNPRLDIQWLDSAHWREIQACDAMAGSILREFLGLPDSNFDLIGGKLGAPVLVIPTRGYLGGFTRHR